MAFDQPRRSGLEYGFALVTTSLAAPVVYAQYVRQCVRRTRRLAGRTNRGYFVAYIIGFTVCFPVFVLMPSYRKQVRDTMGGSK